MELDILQISYGENREREMEVIESENHVFGYWSTNQISMESQVHFEISWKD